LNSRVALLSSLFRLPLEIARDEAVYHTAISRPHRILNNGVHKHGYSILSEPCSEGRTLHVRGGTKPTMTLSRTLDNFAGFPKQINYTTWAGRTSTQSSRASCISESKYTTDLICCTIQTLIFDFFTQYPCSEITAVVIGAQYFSYCLCLQRSHPLRAARKWNYFSPNSC